jgi:cytidylate kinase
MIVAIDGPAGAGKSTTAKALARRLGYAYIDTGAMYRAVALCVSEQGLDPQDETSVSELARALPLRFEDNGTRILVDARDVSTHIRTPEIGDLTSRISALPCLREVIVELQRRIGRESECNCGGAVLEGRDIQTVVFPDAAVKIFLSADPSTRAQRRLGQWQEKEDAVSLEQATRDIVDRDQRDSSRETSPLRAADDAVHVFTDNLSPDEVVEKIAQIVQQKREAEQQAQQQQ